MSSRANYRLTAIVGLIAFACVTPAAAKKDVFQAPGRNLGVWRLTFDPSVRNWANYHNTQCFSPDGRYVCYIHDASSGPVSLRVFDLFEDKEIVIGDGVHPRWARHHNWLFFAHYNPEKRTREYPGTETIRFDMDTRERKVIMPAPGAEALGETTFDDQWLIGAQRFRRQAPQFRYVRIRPSGGFERMPEMTRGSQLLPNPRHPLFFAREDHQSDPFEATRYWYDLDGTNRRLAVPTLQQCHMSWLGNGEYMLLGNGLIRGRKWNEPFPSNVHILASVGVGDISPCGTSGRWVCGDSTLVDLRSGDGWDTVEPLSQICYPAQIGDNSGIYDADPKGSPDGTKICFVSNYPLKDGPRTHIVSYDHRASRLEVESTDDFPECGHLCLYREVIAYESKTPTSFDGIARKAFDTAGVNPRPGRLVTSFQARCLSDQQYDQLDQPLIQLRKSVVDMDSPLMRQRMTDVYVVVARKPDRPHLRVVGDRVELIPGENHSETHGYRVLRDGQPVIDKPVRPGAPLRIDRSGEYQAVAVEWSGLESVPSLPLKIQATQGGSTLKVLTDIPDDFSWTTDRWSDDAKTARETVHLHDGVIRREWFAGGAIKRRHDLNEDDKAIRRTEFKDGKMVTREYHHRERGLVSRELFDADGFITDWIRFQDVDGEPTEYDHWYFERGMPVRHTNSKGREYVKRGDRWGYYREGEFIDTPRE